MQILHAILGAFVMFFGRRLFWIAIGVLGFLIGAQLAGQLMAEAQVAIQLLAALAAGVIGALLAIVFQRVAFAIGGFLAGAYLAHGIVVSMGGNPDFQWIWFAIGGAAGAVIAAFLMDWAIIVLTSLAGAEAIVNTLDLPGGVTGLLFVVLAVLGMAVQAWQFSPLKRTTERHDSNIRSITPQ